jgi:asparagine N-glycosylation enzyme membrane subunit Stt3
MYVGYGFDWGLMAMLYSVLFFIGLLWWFVTTKSKNKLLEISNILIIIGVVFVIAGATSIIIDWIGPLTTGELFFIVGLVVAAVGAVGGLMLTRRDRCSAEGGVAV